jgi:hypothetical protein
MAYCRGQGSSANQQSFVSTGDELAYGRRNSRRFLPVLHPGSQRTRQRIRGRVRIPDRVGARFIGDVFLQYFCWRVYGRHAAVAANASSATNVVAAPLLFAPVIMLA